MREFDQWNTLPLPDLFRRLSTGGLARRLFEIAHDEDLGVDPLAAAERGGAPTCSGGDITSNCCIPPERKGVAFMVARGGGTVAGTAAIPMLMDLFAPGCEYEVRSPDGSRVGAGAIIASLRGPLDELLGLERTLLNLVGRLSGIATRTALHVATLPQGCRAAVYDTRKTTPGLRVLEKYAVRCGGGRCHRMGLHDAVLIKDNHLAGVGLGELALFVVQAANKARRLGRPAFIEVEVDTLDQFQTLLTIPRGIVDIVLLDNMPPEMLRKACALRDAANPALELEASGGITLDTLPEIASTGIDRVSIGGLTHSAVSLDVALDVEG